MDTPQLQHLLEEMKQADAAITDPEQKKMFEQGILAIEMSLELRMQPDSMGDSAGEREAARKPMLVN